MTCPDHDVLIALDDGELGESQAEAVRSHAGGCTRCRAELAALAAIAGDLRAPVPGALAGRSAESFADGVLARLDERRPLPRVSRLPRWVGLIAAAAALPLAAAAAYRYASPPATDEWAARGLAASATTTKRTLVQFGRVSGTSFEPVTDGARLDADALIAAEIGATEGASRFLLAFMVDSTGERHWIYPAYEAHAESAPSPSSIALPSTAAPRVLGSMVRLDRPAPGPARLVAIVLSGSESIDHVEHAAVDQLSREQLEVHYPGALVVTTHVEIH
ncbi:MAG: hypothetical protein KF764_33455 [Labilithrix sp.]|nr:hypothetical protein [Labilithrix sp.]